MKIKIRSAFDPKPDHIDDHPHDDNPEFKTKQEFKNEVDINTIRRNQDNGIQPPPWMTANTPFYGDMTKNPQSYLEAYNLVEEAEAAFESLPIGFRQAIDHDPRNIALAPRELYEQFGLIRPTDDRSGSAARSPGDQRPPQKNPTQATPGASNTAPTEQPPASGNQKDK